MPPSQPQLPPPFATPDFASSLVGLPAVASASPLPLPVERELRVPTDARKPQPLCTKRSRVGPRVVVCARKMWMCFA